jgi:hypothetical protein
MMPRNLTTALYRASARSFALGLLFVGAGLTGVACGSDTKDGDKVAPEIAPAVDGNVIPAGPAVVPNSSAVNSDKKGTEPTLTPTSDTFTSTSSAAVPTVMKFVQFNANPNATDPAKAYSITAYDYDPCIFGFNHGYSVFPTGTFNFVGFYLINSTPAAPLVEGTYSAGSATMGIDTVKSGAGYGLTNCKATAYATVQSGDITITKVGSKGVPTTGSINLTMSDGSKFTGDFGTGFCAGGTNTPPVPVSPDAYACSKLN